MRKIDKVYVDGAFVTPHGQETFDLYNPSTGKVIGQVRLADEVDTRAAIAAAKRAFLSWSATSKDERIAALQRLRDAVAAKREALLDAVVEEYGAPMPRCSWMADMPPAAFQEALNTLQEFEFTRRAGSATVVMKPLGVAGLITPWNSDAVFICGKLAAALAAGCTAVVKPSEMSATQTHVLTEALHEAGLPKGVFNIVTGRGDVVGAELSRHPDITKISFTGSTVVGKTIVREAAGTLKRVTLELGGKSPTIILEDADLNQALPMALNAGFLNSGQSCIAGTRILVPKSKLQEVVETAKGLMDQFRTGDPRDPGTAIGPMVSLRQWERVQGYIRRGIEEGATVVFGGLGRPEGLDGYFVRPTLFSDVTNDMTIAREEIFGPVLSFITYRDEAEAIAIANDTTYGLQAYVLSSNTEHGHMVASQIVAGRVLVNTLASDPKAPFGGFKQSGLGRENGTFGMEAYLEPKSLLVGDQMPPAPLSESLPESQMNHPTARTDLPRNCTFDPGDWHILARSWFPVAIAAKAAAGPVGAALLDQPLVVYRTGMGFIVADDLCPHRGVPLSMGFQDGDGIRCIYHGLRFGAEGKCDHVPANPDMRIPDRLHLKTYPAVEKYGLIWTRLRAPAEANPEKHAIYGIPKMPHWDDPEFQQIVCPTIDIAGFAGRQVEGFLDVAHFGFVHTETFGNPANTRVPSYVPETSDVGFTVDYWSSVANYPVGSKVKSPEGFEWLRHFEVHLPFTASITVHFPDNGRLVVMNCASPVSSRMTRLFVPIARNFDKHIPIEAVHEFNRLVFEEDRRVVEAQKPEFLPLDPVMEAHIPADRSSFAYRKGLRAMGFSRIFAA